MHVFIPILTREWPTEIDGTFKILACTQKRGWLRHNAISKKVMYSILGITGFFNWPNPSRSIMALGSASNRNEYQESSWRQKDSLCIRLSSPQFVSWLSRKMYGPQCLATLWASATCYSHSFTFKILIQEPYLLQAIQYNRKPFLITRNTNRTLSWTSEL
jgi:hypothetical protein